MYIATNFPHSDVCPTTVYCCRRKINAGLALVKRLTPKFYLSVRRSVVQYINRSCLVNYLLLHTLLRLLILPIVELPSHLIRKVFLYVRRQDRCNKQHGAER